MHPRRQAAWLVVAMLAAGGGVWAQSTSSSLKGTVRDTDRRPVPDVAVQALSRSSGIVRNAITDSTGSYRIDLLPPGTWIVVARREDGATSESRTVTLGLQQTVELNLVLGSGLTEQVSVRAEAPLLDPGRTGGELRVAGSRADSLPLSGRVMTDLALLDSSVRSAPPGNFYGERGSVFVINGQSGRANSFLVDGLDNNDQTSGTALNAFFSQQVIREFVVLTHHYAPEFGRASGGVLNIVTERGGNEVGAEVFAQGSSSNLNDPGSFVSSLPVQQGLSDSHRNFSTGFKLGGPFKKDRAFYFLAFEHQEIDQVVPFTGIGRDGVVGGWMEAPNRDDNIFFRTDFNLSPDNFLMVRISGDDRTTHGLNVGGVTTPEAGFELEEQDLQLAASLTTIASPNMLNEVRMLVGASSFNQFANSDRPGVERPSGVFGGNNLNRQLRDEDRIQLVDNLTWRRGSHTMKFGVDVVRSRTRIQVGFNPNGNFLYVTDDPFEPGDCGQLFISDIPVDPNDPSVRERAIREGVHCFGDPNGVNDDFPSDDVVDELGVLLTYPLVFTLIEGEPEAVLDDTGIALFVQDRWQVGPRLLLDYGLRYDTSTFSLPKETSVPSSIPNGGAGRDRDNIAPRLGFTLTPGADRKLVIRGGAGVFYDKLVLAFPGVAAITSGTQIGLTFPQGFTFEITEDVVEQKGLDEVRKDIFFPQELTLRFSTGSELDTPYATQFNLGVERAVGDHGVWEASVIRTQGYHQAVMKDLNPVDTINFLGIPVHRDATTGSIAAVVTEGRSWYTGLDLGWRWRGEQGWLSASYTWSKSLDLGPDPLKGGIYLPPNSDNLLLEKGRSDHDRRHRLVVAGETGLGWMGFRASTVLQLSTGAPFNVTTGRDENLDGITTDRPAGVGRNTGEDTPLGPVNQLRAQEGLPPVGSLREPSLVQVDLRIWKPFGLSDGTSGGEFFLQVFNLLNRFNGGPVEGRIASRSFSEPIGQVGLPRTVELGLKFRF